MSEYNFCETLGSHFGKFYDNATLEKIDGVVMPVAYTGTDYVSLHPKDNECEVSYIRQTQASSISYYDIGGCTKTPYMTDYFRFVVWSNKPFNNFGKLQRFVSLLNAYDVEITSVNNNIEQVYAQETGKGKYIRLKNCGYMAIDFKIENRVSTCDIPC